MTALTRGEAILLISEARFRTASDDDRSGYILSREVLDQLPDHLLKLTDAGFDPGDHRFDPFIHEAIQRELGGFRSAYLSELLREQGGSLGTIEGESEPLPATCPCCGAASLEERGVWEICAVCWWEDDGQDNHNADVVLGGPNGGVSLTEARMNYLRHGIFDPGRADLRPHQVPRYAYFERRCFQMTDDGAGIVEVPVQLCAKRRRPQNNPDKTG